MPVNWQHPEAIVTGEWLETHLGDRDLRIYDCTTYLRYEEGTGRPYRVESGRKDWEAGHIPGSMYLDLQADFSNGDAPTNFMRLTPEETAAAFAKHGVDATNRIILYARASPQWATRFWWMLRWIGFDHAAILDGGMDNWIHEGRPVTTDVTAYDPGSIVAEPRTGLFVDKKSMLSAIGHSSTCSLNALSPDLHSGENPRYGRPGRIPGSTNVPAAGLVDSTTKTLLAAESVADSFAAVGATPDRRVLNYCGGGIAATLDAFLQYQLGYEDIAVYDASMSEWAKDDAMPMEVDDN